jgi:hypothetical protein
VRHDPIRSPAAVRRVIPLATFQPSRRDSVSPIAGLPSCKRKACICIGNSVGRSTPDRPSRGRDLQSTGSRSGLEFCRRKGCVHRSAEPCSPILQGACREHLRVCLAGRRAACGVRRAACGVRRATRRPPPASGTERERDGQRRRQ